MPGTPAGGGRSVLSVHQVKTVYTRDKARKNSEENNNKNVPPPGYPVL